MKEPVRFYRQPTSPKELSFHEVHRGLPRHIQSAGPTVGWVGAAFAFFAGAMSPLPFNIVGKIYGIEFALLALAPLGLMIFVRMWHTERWASRLGFSLGISIVAYIVSDLVNGTEAQQFLRGWARFFFLGTSLLGALWLVRDPKGLIGLCAGLATGQTLAGLGTLGDTLSWKFGVGEPLTLVVVLVACRWQTVGRVLLLSVAGAHFILDYRSLGLISCMIFVASVLAGSAWRTLRSWPMALFALAIVAVITVAMYSYAYTDPDRRQRAAQSNVERLSMAWVSIEAAAASPLVGYGSWARNPEFAARTIEWRAVLSDASFDDMLARTPPDEREIMASHSYLLQSIVEGGLFATTFFLVSLGLIWSVIMDLWKGGRRVVIMPLLLYILAGTLWAICFSPFSGPHRYSLAIALALALQLKVAFAASTCRGLPTRIG